MNHASSNLIVIKLQWYEKYFSCLNPHITIQGFNEYMLFLISLFGFIHVSHKNLRAASELKTKYIMTYDDLC